MAEKVRSQIVGHPLAEANVEKQSRQSQGPYEQEDHNRPDHAPNQESLPCDPVWQGLQRPRQGLRNWLLAYDLVNEHLHGPWLEYVQTNFQEHHGQNSD